jgi:hypothetical protein
VQLTLSLNEVENNILGDILKVALELDSDNGMA